MPLQSAGLNGDLIPEKCLDGIHGVSGSAHVRTLPFVLPKFEPGKGWTRAPPRKHPTS